MRFSLKKTAMTLLFANLFPVMAFAAWSPAGQDFSSELILGGPVTSQKNPWVWKLGQDSKNIRMIDAGKETRNGGQIWQGFGSEQVLLTGKTILTTPTGRDGLAPRVTFGGQNDRVDWLPDGEAQVTLQVQDSSAPTTSIGQVSFRMKAAAVTQYRVGGRVLISTLYNDLTGNGLPPKLKGTDESRALLCGILDTEAPAWLCSKSQVSGEKLALSNLTNANLHQIDGVYGAKIVAGSGGLVIDAGAQPEAWQASLSVSVEYQ